MGNVESSSHYHEHLSRFLPDEQADIDSVFVAISGSGEAVGGKGGKPAKKGVTLMMLKAHVKDALPESMVIRLYNGMKSIPLAEKSPGSNGQVGKEQFVVFMSALFKGNAEEKKGIVMKMISNTDSTVKGSQIIEFAEDLVGSVVHVLSYRKMLKGWNLKNMQNSTTGIKALASQFMSELKADGKRLEGGQVLDAICDESSIEDWVFRVPQVSTFLSVVVQQGLFILHSLPDQEQETLPLLPECQGVRDSRFVSLLDIPSVTYINSHLPSKLQHKWRLLFVSQVHGQSFTQLCGHIVNQGPCVLVLKDTDGYIFGGFSSCSWVVKPQFQGNNGCFLFSVSPSLEVFTNTGYNDHYMYLNHGQETMPNGLGMGGQHEYFGLWIDSNYGRGHSKAKPRCTTYNSPQLSAKENFTLDAMEVWAVGDPESAAGTGPKSVLDADPEAQALLEMIGKGRKSDGFRDPGDGDGGDN
ncbi:MTOR-associated protein MEAK7 isoform X2 [Lacerta agilis]|uniref:MTOR-associated protein MEAK7 isoform X2 n=1 Tax=Lacerta agilis TaxID=80427 RepID=UPI001419259F|nr:MTOR-associated protein MEAK7 isoform X2 [Lacerta agilis]